MDIAYTISYTHYTIYNKMELIMNEKISDAKIKANKKWDEKNKARKNYLNARSSARSFIKNKSTEEDLEEFISLIEERRIELKKG